MGISMMKLENWEGEVRARNVMVREVYLKDHLKETFYVKSQKRQVSMCRDANSRKLSM